MLKIFEIMTGYKTYILGVVAVVSGIGTILISGGDFVQIQTGWTQIMAGFGMIFIRNGVKNDVAKVETAVEDVKIENQTTIQGLRSREF